MASIHPLIIDDIRFHESVGPIDVYTPCSGFQRLSLSSFLYAVENVYSALQQFHVPDHLYSGMATFRDSDEMGRGAGRYSKEHDTIEIAINGNKDVRELSHTLSHELAHRIWYRIGAGSRQRWREFIKYLDGERTDWIKESMLAYFAKRFPRQNSTFHHYWYHNSDTINFLPSQYAGTYPPEAFAEVLANLLFGSPDDEGGQEPFHILMYFVSLLING